MYIPNPNLLYIYIVIYIILLSYIPTLLTYSSYVCELMHTFSDSEEKARSQSKDMVRCHHPSCSVEEEEWKEGLKNVEKK